MEALTFAHYVVLTHAADESSLREVLAGVDTLDAEGRRVEDLPRLSLEEARDALRDLITSGAVEIWEGLGGASTLLPPARALAAIEDDSHWSPEKTVHVVVITDAGYEPWNRAYALYGARKPE